MPIDIDEETLEELFQKFAEAGAKLDQQVGNEVGEQPPDNLQMVAPHEVYSLDLDAGRRLATSPDAAVQTGWRALLMLDEKTIGAIEIAPDVNPSVVSVGDERPAVAFQDAVLRAEGQQEIEAGTFEARLLRIPPVSTELLWLPHPNSNSQDDWFVPVLGAPQLPREGRVLFSFAEVYEAISADAEAVSAYDFEAEDEV